MRSFSEVWKAAISANARYCANRDDGGKYFEKLLREYPTDGMVLYSRGEALEWLKDLEGARADFQRASKTFPDPKWKEVAVEGSRRVSAKLAGGVDDGNYLDWRSALHRIYQTPLIANDNRFHTLDALSSFPEHPRQATESLRNRLLDLLNELLCEDGNSLQKQVDVCKRRFKPPRKAAFAVKELKWLGDEATHKNRHARPASYYALVPDYVATIFEWANGIVKEERQPRQ